MTVQPQLPATFRSEASLAAAVDAAFAEALAQELAAVLAGEPAAPTSPAQPAIVLPDTDTLIRQAGIVTGPCDPDPRAPSRTGLALRAGGRNAGRAAGWLLTTAGALALRGAIAAADHLLDHPEPPTPHAEEPAHLTAPGEDPAPSDLLDAASAEIHRRGWTQGALETTAGAVCIHGAERALLHAGYGDHHTIRRANHHLARTLWIPPKCIPAWNDQHDRTENQIHTALLTAAARARAAGE